MHCCLKWCGSKPAIHEAAETVNHRDRLHSSVGTGLQAADEDVRIHQSAEPQRVEADAVVVEEVIEEAHEPITQPHPSISGDSEAKQRPQNDPRPPGFWIDDSNREIMDALRFPVYFLRYMYQGESTRLEEIYQKCYIALALNDINAIRPEGELTEDGELRFNGARISPDSLANYDRFVLLWKNDEGRVCYQEVTIRKWAYDKILIHKLLYYEKFELHWRFSLCKLDEASARIMKQFPLTVGCYKMFLLYERRNILVSAMNCLARDPTEDIVFNLTIVKLNDEYVVTHYPGWLIDGETQQYTPFFGGQNKLCITIL